APWLTVIGLGEDGPAGLSEASRSALERAEIVMGPPRHLGMLDGMDLRAEPVAWPVPFSDGIPVLLGYRGRPVAVLASGDPVWFGAGASLIRHVPAAEMRVYPGASTFALIAARMGWALEDTHCAGLHAQPLALLLPHLAARRRMIVYLRDGPAVADLGAYLAGNGWGETHLSVFEAVGGPRERRTEARATEPGGPYAHPVAVAFEVDGEGPALPLASGRPDAWFDHDGQLTKRPVRALTLSALAPQPFEHLWDIGSGSGSVAIEWLLADRSLRASAVERHPERARRISANAARFGVEDRLNLVEGEAPGALTDLPSPAAVFVGGGLDLTLLDRLCTLPPGTRLVANAVTLESEALLAEAHAARGGTLLRVNLAEAASLGQKRGWQAAYPITQWSTSL
ncbi:MAG: precorrin-6y C5,15-methyltransferase (decarboxylating) subunit CbiE, partial [Pseudomonadota bacterium]